MININTVIINVGGICTGYFDIIDSSINLTPTDFSFLPVTEASSHSNTYSIPQTLTGLTPSCPITLVASNGLVDAGTSTLSGVFQPAVRVITSATGSIVVQLQLTTEYV